MRKAFPFLACLALLMAACVDPPCPNGYEKLGAYCKRLPPDAGMVDAGTTSSRNDATPSKPTDSGVEGQARSQTEAGTHDAAIHGHNAETDLQRDGQVQPVVDAGAPSGADSGPQIFWYRDCDDDGYSATTREYFVRILLVPVNALLSQ